MMKKIVAFLAALMILAASAALADNLKDLSDEELTELWQAVVTEMEDRGMYYGYRPSAEEPEKTAMLERVVTFFKYWAANDLDGMTDLCSADWRESEEYPQTALFALLANRTPKELTVVNVSGGENDAIRTVTVNTLMDRNDGRDPALYYLNILMLRDGDGKWYVYPKSLQTYEPIGIEETEAPEMPDATEGDITLYYVPEGGEYYHADQNCPRVNDRFLPMSGMFLYSELNDEPFRGLKPCAICGAPQREE